MEARKKIKQKKLSSLEVEAAAGKIRKQYSEFVASFNKPESIKLGFETRLKEALVHKLDMGQFLQAEILAVKELISREETKLIDKSKKNLHNLAAENKRREDHADRVLNELSKRIEKYPSLDFIEEASNEMKRLSGAMGQLERDYIYDAEKIIKKYGNGDDRERFQIFLLETLNFLPSRRVPKVFYRYEALHERREKDYNEINNEEKRVLLSAAGILHFLKDWIEGSRNNSDIDSQERKILENIYTFVDNMLIDFRLKDLKPAGK